jgi:hypothetical protein
MSDSVRVIIQVRATPSLAPAAFGPVAAAPPVPGISELPGVQFAAGLSPVPIPPKPTAGAPAAAFTVSEPSTYVVRATVNNEALSNFLDQANNNPNVVGVFSDSRIQPIAVRPSGPLGTDLDVEELLLVEELKRRGMNGAGVKVAILDTGVNFTYLRSHGKTPGFDSTLSWGPWRIKI